MPSLRLLLLALVLAIPPAGAADWKDLSDPPPDRPGKPPAALDVAVPKSFFDPELTFADAGGPFAAVGRNGGKDDRRVVVDLRTGKTVGTLAGELKVRAPMALSRNGTRFAAAADGFRGNSVVVLDVATGQAVAEVTPTGRPDHVQFVGPDRLLVADAEHAQVFALPGGKPAVELKLDRNPWRNARVTASPGGKYLFVPADGEIRAVAAGTGAEAARIPTPKEQNLDALAVAPDGKRLAYLTERFNKRTLVILDLATGKTITDAPVDGPKNPFYTPKLAWAADGTGLLLAGEAVLDPASGKVLYAPPAEMHNRTPRLALSAGTVVVLDATKRDDRRLKTVGLSADKLAAARAAVAAGGTAADALLPPLIQADSTKAKPIEVPLAGVPWSAAADPAPAAPVAARPVPLPFKLAGLVSVRVSHGPRPSAVFEFAALNNVLQPDPARPRTVRRVDLYTGRQTAERELPPGCKVIDLAADGSAVVTTDLANGRRTDVFPLGGSGKPVGLRPYDREPEAERAVAFAALVAADRLLTVSNAGKVVAWRLPAGTAEYVAEVPGLVSVTLTPGRKYLCGVQAGAVRLFAAADGRPAGDLLPPFTAPPTADPNNPPPLAIRADGGEFAAVLPGPDRVSRLIRWTVNGQLLGETAAPPVNPLFPNSPGGIRLTYVGADYLLANEASLFDLRRLAVVWTYALSHPGEGRFAAQRPDGRAWYAVADGGANGALVAADLPGPAAEKAVAAAAEGAGAILKPGATVSLTVKFTGGQAATAEPKVRQAVKKALADRGQKLVDADGEVEVTLTVAERETGDKLDFRNIGPGAFGPGGRRSDTARVIELEATAAVSAGGRTVWTSPAEKLAMPRVFGILHLPADEKDVEKYLHKQTWDGVAAWAVRAVPRFLAETPDGPVMLPQMSMLSPTGPTAAPAGKPMLRRRR